VFFKKKGVIIFGAKEKSRIFAPPLREKQAFQCCAKVGKYPFKVLFFDIKNKKMTQ
jgi:hypothetical protein